MKEIQNTLFKTFMLQNQHGEYQVRYTGNREILIPDYKKPTYIRCTLEFEGEYIPVIDPNIWFCGEETQASSSACILIVEHRYEYRKLRTGIIISDTKEVMRLARGNYKSRMKQFSFNMRFVLKIPKKVNMSRMLSNSHFALLSCKRQKQADEDFAAFVKKIRDGISFKSPHFA